MTPKYVFVAFSLALLSLASTGPVRGRSRAHHDGGGGRAIDLVTKSGAESQVTTTRRCGGQVDPAMANRSAVYVYDGPGAGPTSRKMLVKALETWLDTTRYTVKGITPEQILLGNWTEDAALVAFGGGYDSGFVKSLGKDGTAIVRNYVLSGGSYLGICAGGYFGCAEVEFDKGGPLEVVGKRDLGFFPGKCIGPAFPGFDYNSRKGARAAKVTWKIEDSVSSSDLDVKVYYNGGGYFQPYNNETLSAMGRSVNYEYIGLYSELDGKLPAIAKCTVGKGVALLSGAHWEFLVEDMDSSDPYLKKIIPKLEASLKYRDTYFKSVIKHLRL